MNKMMTTTRKLVVGGAVVTLATGLTSAMVTPATPDEGDPRLRAVNPAPSVAGARCSWSIASAPNPRYADLSDIDGVGARQIWAVGSRQAAGAPLAMRWNGRRWARIPTPDPSSFVGLEGVAVGSFRNAWAVGWYWNGSRLQTLILRWNGVRWARVPSPNPLRGDNLLFDVAIGGPNNAWAVGTNNLHPGAGDRKIILRWNGTRWVNDRPGSGRGSLESVATRSGTVLAAGHDGDGPLVMRRTPSGWVTSPMTRDALHGLQSIDAADSGPFRAVGTRLRPSRIATRAMHSGPSGWVEDATPNRGRGLNVLHDVSTRNGTAAWAVGFSETDRFVDRTLTLRFSNGSWSLVASPNPNRRDSVLRGVYAVPRSRVVWAVGLKTDSISASHPLVMRYHC